MSLLLAWVAFPLALTAIAVGCGLLLDVACGRRIPGALIAPVGLAAVIVAAQFAILSDATAELAVPLVGALAVAGFAIDRPWRHRRIEPWSLAPPLAVFVLYGAPVLASGEATFAGYVKLDDTATWLAFTDRVMEHGRNLDGLPLSSYEATLDFNLGQGYPVGTFLPLGIGSIVTGQDPAWTFEPYLALLAAMLALALWSLAGPLVRSPGVRAIVVFVAAQPAILVGYALWGGVKEIAAAALIPLVAALAFPALGGDENRRLLIAFATALAALAGVLSAGGAVWVAPILAIAILVGVRSLGVRTTLGRIAGLIGVATVLAIPAIVAGLPPTSAPLTSAEARGNLLGPLNVLQVAGIWPSGDFRFGPDLEPLTVLLIGIAVAGAAVGVALAIRRRTWSMPAYVLGVLASCGLIVAFGSPWVDGKALATASPAVLLAAAVAGAVLLEAGPRAAGGAIVIALVAGVAWSNALAYREVNLAPRAQLAELDRIGDRIDGQGPTLITEYQPYGARHFLRDADPEAVSELRRRRLPLRGGGTVRKGHSADTDELALAGLLVYGTLVVRRSPAQSRPPSPYRPTYRGRYYEVWRRAVPDRHRVLAHMSLGDALDPTGVPRCSDVVRLARGAGPRGHLLASRRATPIVVRLRRARHPAAWESSRAGARGLLPRGDGTVHARVGVPTRDVYDVWMGGSARGRLDVAVDGRRAGSARHQINNPGQYVWLGEVPLSRGRHEITLAFHGADLHPGSGGAPFAAGPVSLSSAGAADARIRRVPAARARSLCAHRWDWIETVAP
jgi:hypothetical protein